MAATSVWLKEQAKVQHEAAMTYHAMLGEDARTMGQFIVAMTTAQVFNGLAVAVDSIAAEQHLSATDGRRQRISEELQRARSAATQGFSTGDWSDFDALILGPDNEPSEQDANEGTPVAVGE